VQSILSTSNQGDILVSILFDTKTQSNVFDESPAKVQPGAKTDKKKSAPKAEFDLSDSSLYLNRELTWLEFNRRVLHEAEDLRTPLLERIKFIAIVSANLDEFFMKRIGGLKQQIGAGVRELTLDGRTPRQQVAECHAVIRELESRKNDLFRDVCAILEDKNITIEKYAGLSAKEKKQLREHFLNNVFPLLTPQSIDPAHPFPFISNLSLNLLVAVRYPKLKTTSLARIKVFAGKDQGSHRTGDLPNSACWKRRPFCSHRRCDDEQPRPALSGNGSGFL